MSKKPMKITTKLGLGAVAGCAVCCIPIVVPFVVAIGGAGAAYTGAWLVGGIIFVAALAAMLLRRKKTCGGKQPANCAHCPTET